MQTITQLQARSSALLALQHQHRDTGDHDTADRIMHERDTITDEIQDRLRTIVGLPV